MSNTVIIDVGSSTTKFGYSSKINYRPLMVIPTVYRSRDVSNKASAFVSGAEDLDFYIGNEGLNKRLNYVDRSFVKRGIVEDWDALEHFYEQIFFRYLRVDPEDTPVFLTEPPLNKPDNREYTAEIMFESFNVPHLFICMQGICSLYSVDSKEATGVIVESSEGTTSVIPIANSSVITEAITQIELGGMDVTRFIADMLKEREPTVPTEDRLDCAAYIKENHCRFHPQMNRVSDMFHKFDEKPEEYIIVKELVSKKSGKSYRFEIGHEQFLAPETLFYPEMLSSKYTTPISHVINNSIQRCPIGYRKYLYSNIILSGGNTRFSKIDNRLKNEVTAVVNECYKNGENNPIVNVSCAPENSAYIGANEISQRVSLDAFYTKKAYDEIGPSIARMNNIFGNAIL